MNGLRLAENLSLPIDVTTQALAFMGRRGSGKSYAATKLAELLYEARAQFIAFDPVGIWYGLRLSADGKGTGLDIPIFGGLHGDLPLEATGGTLIADLVVERNLSAIVDVSQFESDADKSRFATDFAARFFFLKKSRPSAVHIFVEEAQEFIPQNLQRGEEKMLHNWQRMIRLGRNYGIGVSMISQRPQDVSKKALNQAECLLCFQLTGPQERKAIEGWISERGLKEDLDAVLPQLKVGQAHIWSPVWLDINATYHISAKETFAAGTTPKVGAAQVKTISLAPLEMEQLAKDMAATVQRAKENDPKELKRRIRQLETQQPVVNTEEVEMLKESMAQLQADAGAMEAELDAHRKRDGRVRQAFASLAAALDEPIPSPLIVHVDKLPTVKHTPARILPLLPSKQNSQEVNLRRGARSMLAVLCQWSPAGRTEAQVAAQVRMKKTGGTWSAYKSDLKNGGFIEIGGDGLWYATETGRDYLGADVPDVPSTTSEVVNLWGAKLRRGAREMLDVLVNHRGHVVSREDLGAAVSMEPTGGTFSAYLTDLKQAGLILVGRDGVRANKETLFL